jgi:hypothetical protein
VVEDAPRHVAPGGVKRLVIGFVCGLAAGALIALVLPRDDGPRRQSLSIDPALDLPPDPARAAVAATGRATPPDADRHRAPGPPGSAGS